jgi:hypothetical protein
LSLGLKNLPTQFSAFTIFYIYVNKVI